MQGELDIAVATVEPQQHGSVKFHWRSVWNRRGCEQAWAPEARAPEVVRSDLHAIRRARVNGLSREVIGGDVLLEDDVTTFRAAFADQHRVVSDKTGRHRGGPRDGDGRTRRGDARN